MSILSQLSEDTMQSHTTLYINGLNPGDKRWSVTNRSQHVAVAMHDVRTATIGTGEPSGGLPRRRDP